MQFSSVLLLANSGNNVGNAASGYSNTIRDWVLGDEIGELDVGFDSSKFPYEFKWTGTELSTDPDFNPPTGATGTAAPMPTKSSQRISHLTKIPLASPAITINDSNRNWTTTNSSISSVWLANSTSWVTATSSNFGYLGSSNSSSTDAKLAAPSASANFTSPSDPSLSDSVSNAVYASNSAADMREPFLATGNYSCPADLGLVPTNQRWRRLRMQLQPRQEVSSTYGGNLTAAQNYIPDWAMLDVISFGNSTDPKNAFSRIVPANINGRFNLPGNITNPSPPAPRTIAIQALAKVLEISSNGTIQDPMNPAFSVTANITRFRGNTANATTIAKAIGNMTWSSNSCWDNRRNLKGFPTEQYVVPSEIMEIEGVADAVSQTDYSNSSSHFKWNEGRASALIPAITTRSAFFTIYAFAQAGQLKNKTLPESASNPFIPDSEVLTKTLVEIELDTPATASSPARYKVKKLYTQSITPGN